MPKKSKNASASTVLPAVCEEESTAEQSSIRGSIQSLVRKRAYLKSKLSRLSNYFSRVKDEDPNSATICEIEMRLKDIESNLLMEFSDLQYELQGLDSENFTESELNEFENIYFKVTSEIKQFLSYKNQIASSYNQLAPLIKEGESQGTVFGQAIKRPSAKLPIIELPKFSGHFDKWLEFRDLYVSLVHKSEYLDPIEKFQYLKASLEGSAAQCIQAFTICSENYEIAWDIVCQRFENKKLIVHNHIKSLFNLYEVKAGSSNAFRNMVDIISKNVRSLENLGINTDHWDPLIVYLVTSKLDLETIREWEQQPYQDELPSLSELKSFLSARADFFDKVSMHKEKSKKVFFGQEKSAEKQFSCYYCKEAHSIYNCSKFLDLSVPERQGQVKSLKLCPNCLHSGHKLEKCRSSKCRHCKQNHNSLLHLSYPNETSKITKGESVSLHNQCIQGQVLLATATVEVFDLSGKKHLCRALLDSGSMSNFISEECANKLGGPQHQINSSVMGIGQNHSVIKRSYNIQIKSCHSKFRTSFNCLVISEITSQLPNFYFDPSTFNIPAHCVLADPTFSEPGPIDLLIGAEVFWDLVCTERVSLGPGQPIVQKSKLGWFISGPFRSPRSNKSFCHFSKSMDVQSELAKFWELEELPFKPFLSDDELQAEKHFSETTRRTSEGRFMVSVPLKAPPDILGDSKGSAASQFISLERKLQKNPKLKEMYIDFMSEYEALNHMSLYPVSDQENAFFSPHHGVLREDSSTTKLRVVFNSSAVSSSGYSYNSIQRVGPVVQDDLLSIVLRFRQHQYVFSADICKMYRQILVQEKFRPLQLIFWRVNPDEELKVFSLNTVTYGTASAPFLATRCLKQLALDHASSNPAASQVIGRDFYVDDLLSGADSVSEAVQLCRDVMDILQSGKFELRKWKSNCKEILDDIIPSDSIKDSYFFGSTDTSKTLGMLWSCETDSFLFSIKLPVSSKRITKRVILSEVARIYDPLGLLSPVVIRAKIFLQILWSLKLSWDQEVPNELAQKWLMFRSELHELNKIKLSRCISCKHPKSVQLHGFSDASNSAYGACIYLRTQSACDEVTIELVASKTRVAPLKSVTIPRLELCGALLLANLFDKVKTSLTIKFDVDQVFLWCDSTVTLAWLRSCPSTLQVFVANRVANIQNLTKIQWWRYVPTETNPADLLSRGLSPPDLVSSTVWFHGPGWLQNAPSDWPCDVSLQKPILIYELPETRKSTQIFLQINQDDLFPFKRFSSFNKVIRVTAYCLRVADYAKCVKKDLAKPHGNLTIFELHRARDTLLKMSQRESFPDDFGNISKHGAVTNKSKLLSLTPFLDNDIIRVGGRLKNSSFPCNKKHPALLSARHHLTYLLFKHEHKMLLHCGPQLLLSHIRENFWPIAGRNLARRVTRECLVCFRYNPQTIFPIMGNLPTPRVTPSLPFCETGVDYAGPFLIKDRKGRGTKTSKCYLALFICLATRAVHLEVVSELSTQAFLETLQRFIGRRGKPTNIYSDNGTNFVGAYSQLRDLGRYFREQETELKVKLESTYEINWHFIPAYSPHHGGLWEAGIKSAKHHIKRVLSDALLTFESFYTVIVQIEGVLNSRPLTPLSSDPNDYAALTPAHFLLGRSLQSIPHPDLRHLPINRLSHFERLESLKQHFWSRWCKEYVGELQQKVKWKNNSKKISVGTLVLVRDNNLPPNRWKLGRVIQLHPGSDSVVRVVSIKTRSGVIQRAVVKICPLPVEGNDA